MCTCVGLCSSQSSATTTITVHPSACTHTITIPAALHGSFCSPIHIFLSFNVYQIRKDRLCQQIKLTGDLLVTSMNSLDKQRLKTQSTIQSGLVEAAVSRALKFTDPVIGPHSKQLQSHSFRAEVSWSIILHALHRPGYASVHGVLK